MAQKDVSWILQKAWPGWTVTRLIGKGSYGSVYEIQKEDFGEVFTDALKVIRVPSEGTSLPAGLSQEDKTTFLTDMAEQILKEYKILEMLSGTSNIMNCKGYVCEPDADGKGWTLLIRLELLTELDKYYQKNGCSRQDVVRLGIDICRALELCEKYKVIHRDIKPGNIFVSMHGDYKLGDFGVAKTLEETGCAATKQGTANYMAPEVYRAVPYDHTADLYSLGMVLYTLMNGCRLPFMSGANTYSEQKRAFERRIKGEALPMPSNEKGTLGRVAQKACSYNPLQRYQSAAEMRRDLERLVDSTDKAIYILPDGVARTKDIQLRFLDENGAVLHTQTYKVGEEIMLPPEPPKKDKRVFKQWFPALPKVATEDLDFTATYQVVTPPAPPKPEKPHKEPNKKVLPIVVSCLLVAAIALGLWLVKPWEMFGEKNGKDQEVAIQQQPEVKPVQSVEEGTSEEKEKEQIPAEDEEEKTPETVSQVRLSNTELVMVPGEEIKLAATTFPRHLDVSIAWESSNSEAATIDYDGVLRAWKEGTSIITAEADGIKAKCIVTVQENAVTEIKVVSLPEKQVYYVGDNDAMIDHSGMELEVTYLNGDTEIVNSGFSVSCNFDSVGKKEASVTYAGEQTTFLLDVRAVALESIRIDKYPTQLNYTEGDLLKTDGIRVTAVYNNGERTLSNSDLSFSVSKLTQPGNNQTVTVSYSENGTQKTTQFSINVTAMVRYSILAKSSNSQYGVAYTELDGPYLEGETVTLIAEPKNGCVFLEWSDGVTNPKRSVIAKSDETYTAVFLSPLSDWSEVVPSGATICEEKTQYRYQDKEFKTSSDANLSGWTQYDSDWTWGDFGPMSEWSSTSVAESDTTKVETRTVYHYYYFVCSSCGAHWHGSNACFTWGGGCGSSSIPASSYTVCESTIKAYSQTADWHGTGVRYAYIEGNELAFAYTSSSSPYYVAPKTQYCFATREKEYTYYYYRWSNNWSEYSDTRYTPSDNRKVETRKVYQYRLR